MWKSVLHIIRKRHSTHSISVSEMANLCVSLSCALFTAAFTLSLINIPHYLYEEISGALQSASLTHWNNCIFQLSLHFSSESMHLPCEFHFLAFTRHFLLLFSTYCHCFPAVDCRMIFSSSVSLIFLHQS